MSECPKCQTIMNLKKDPVFPLKSYYHCPSCLNDFPLKYKKEPFVESSMCQGCGNKTKSNWKNSCVIF